MIYDTFTIINNIISIKLIICIIAYVIIHLAMLLIPLKIIFFNSFVDINFSSHINTITIGLWLALN